MENNKFLLGILVMVLVFGMMVIGCDDGNDNGSGGLNGTWIGINADPSDPATETTYNNGKFESKWRGGVLVNKGIYTTNSGTLTFKPTHVGGNSPFLGPVWFSSELKPQLENKWYSKEELKTAVESLDGWDKHPHTGFESVFGREFSESTLNYSISDGILYFTTLDGTNAGKYKRK